MDNNHTVRDGKYGAAVFVLCLSSLMASIDTGIVGMGLSTIEKALNTSFAATQWVVLAYLLAVTSLIVGIGRIGDIFGKKRLFIFGIALFTLTSLLCALSANVYQLIIFRAAQGIGGAILMTLTFAIMGDIVPEKKLPRNMAAITATIPIGCALGPALGGVLIGAFGWRSMFLINVPIGIASLLLCIGFPPVPISEKVRHFDFPGMIVLTASLTAFVLGVTLAEDRGFDTLVTLLAAGALVGLIAFILIEKNSAFPLIELAVFKNTVFSASLIVSVLLYASVNGYCILLPFYLQEARGFSTGLSGLLMMVGPLACAIYTPFSSIAAERIGNEKIMSLGILMVAAGIFAMAHFSLATTVFAFVATMFFFHGFISFFQTPNFSFNMSRSKPEQRGLSSSLLHLARTVGQISGAAVYGAVFYHYIGTKSVIDAGGERIVSGIYHALTVQSIALFVGFIVCLAAYKPWKKSLTLERN